MSLLSAVLVASGAGLVIGGRRRARLAVAGGAFLFQPVLALLGALGFGAWNLRTRLRAKRRRSETAASDVILLGELVGLGLSAGLTLTASLAAARPHMGEALREELGGLERRSTRSGMAEAMAAGDGYGHRFYLVAARALVSGAPLGPAIDAFVRDSVAEQHAGRVEAARRLPVRLTLPLALLILPGFVLLTVGPAVMGAFERLVLPR